MSKVLQVVPPVIDRTQFQYNPLPAHPRRPKQTNTVLTGDEAIRRLTQAIQDYEAEAATSAESSPRKRRRQEPDRRKDRDSPSDHNDPQEAAHWRKIVYTFLDSKAGRLPSLAILSSPSIRIYHGDNRCFQCRLLPRRCNINNKTWICATAKLPGKTRKCLSCYMMDGATDCTFPLQDESSDESDQDAGKGSGSSENETPIYRQRRAEEIYKGSDIASDSDADSLHTSENSRFDFNPEREGTPLSEGISTGFSPSSISGSSIFSTDSYDGTGAQTNRNHPGRKGLRQSYRELRNWAHELRPEVGEHLFKLVARLRDYERSLDQ